MQNFAQRAFAGGEISPALYGRADQAKYATGLRTCRNFIVQRFGGVTNRPGTEFIAETKDSGNPRLIDFVFNSDQTYILEVGNEYVRFYQNGVQLSASDAPTFSMATPYTVGDYVVNNGSYYYCVQDTIGNPTGDTDYWYQMAGSALEMPSPWLTADLDTLKHVQSADTVTVASANHALRRIERLAAKKWRIVTYSFEPSQAPVTNLTQNQAAGSGYEWAVVAIDDEGNESDITTVSSSTNPSGTPVTLSWTAAANAVRYAVYKDNSGIFGFIGTSGNSSFTDNGIDPDMSLTPIESRNPFNAMGDYPSVVAYHQQRLVLANTTNNPETVWMSRSGDFENFGVHSPLQDDDAVTFTVAGNQVNEIRNIIGLRSMALLNSGAEYIVEGTDGGVITPSSVLTVPEGYNGSSILDAITIGGNALFVQDRGSLVRDFQVWQDQGYRGRDLTVFAQHLFDGFTISDWDYARTPNSIVWVVRSDGTLLGLTYLPEHEIWGWHRHDTDGSFNRVAVIPEGDRDVPYFVVERTIDGVTKRYIERMSNRQISDILDSRFLDSFLIYDGRNTTSTTMTITTATTYESLEDLTLTSSAPFFSAGDVGNGILARSGDDLVRLSIVAYTGVTEVTVRSDRTVPVSLQNAATTDWDRQVDEFSGLDHLEGKTVGIFADGFVLEQETVSGGSVTTNNVHSLVVIGLPYLSDFETLNIETVGSGSMIGRKIRIPMVNILVQQSRGIFAGISLDRLKESKVRNLEGYDDPVRLLTDSVEIVLNQGWQSAGRIAIRQSDPLPITIQSVVPTFEMGQ